MKFRLRVIVLFCAAIIAVDMSITLWPRVSPLITEAFSNIFEKKVMYAPWLSTALTTDVQNFLWTIHSFHPVAVGESLMRCVAKMGRGACYERLDNYTFAIEGYLWKELCTALNQTDTGVISLELETNQHIIFLRLDASDQSNYFRTTLPDDKRTQFAMPKFAWMAVTMHAAHEPSRALFFVPKDVSQFLRDLYARSGRFIDCNRTLAGQMHARFPDSFAERTGIPDKAIYDFLSLLKVLDQFNAPPMLTCGTLLGWYRECGIIHDTTDFDITIDASEYTPHMLRYLKIRFSVYNVFGNPIDGFQFTVHTGQAKVDVFLLYTNGTSGQNWIQGYDSKTDRKIRWKFPPIERGCVGALFGHLVAVPCNVEAVLMMNYGRRFDVPHPDNIFNWITSPKNAEFLN